MLKVRATKFATVCFLGDEFFVLPPICSTCRFGDHGRISAVDLRKLFLHKPELAAVLYDTMLEDGIVSEEAQEQGYDEDDGLEELGITMDDLALMQETGQADEGNETV